MSVIINGLACRLMLSGVLIGTGVSVWAQDAERLARDWCASCHAYPAPEGLSRDIWMGSVLPQMGARLGFTFFHGVPFVSDPNTPDGVYQPDPVMSDIDWAQIINWYETQAPEELPVPDWQPRVETQMFSIETPLPEEHGFPTTTAIHIDETHALILVADSYALDMELYDADLVKRDELRVGGAISRILPLAEDRFLVATMGGNIGQSESPFGLISEISADPDMITRMIPRLRRPVDVDPGDFNADGMTDYIVSEFGTHTGKLSVHLSQPDGTLREVILSEDAGPTSVHVEGDTLYALIAQGDERVIRLSNFAGEDVKSETLLRFPPSMGVSSLAVGDVDGDGTADLLLTAGDNADISPIYKPYHGIYLYRGNQGGGFDQSWFFHLDGATSAIALDFDLDGDVDIAAIAYYANIARDPDQTLFVYLENTGGTYTPTYIEGIGQLGRYIAMSAGDIDGDGDADIALANMAFGPYGPLNVTDDLRNAWVNSTGFVLLRNQIR